MYSRDVVNSDLINTHVANNVSVHFHPQGIRSGVNCTAGTYLFLAAERPRSTEFG